MKNIQDKQSKNYKQAGVTMLLAVMILTAMFIVTVTVSYLGWQELKSSRANTLSEPAIVAAETGGEQGLWMIFRNSFSDTCPANNPTQADGTTNSSGNPSRTVGTKCISYGPAIIELKPDEQFTFFLYDPNNINGNTCMEDDLVCPLDGGGSGNQLFTDLIFDYIAGSFTVTATAATLDGQSVGNIALSSAISNQIINIPSNIANSNDERIKVTVTSPNYATVQVTTAGLINGMPDYPTIDSQGCSSLSSISDCDESREVFKRRINITVPRP